MSQVFKKGRGQSVNLLSTPLLPQKRVKSVLISCEYPQISLELSRKFGIETIEVVNNNELAGSISSHADCCFFQLDKNNIFIDKSNYDNIVNYLTILKGEAANQINIYSERVFSPYPDDVALNLKVIGDKIICNTNNMSDSVKIKALELGFSLIHVNQGYSACSSMVINENAMITDDESIYYKSKLNGIDCLLISKGSVRLNGFDYGFIGGTCGMIDKNLIAFTGSIHTHTDYKLISDFLNKYNIDYIELTNGPLTDIGGIIPLTE